ncbi:AAA family ATPase [Fomitopsis serialis]|uniref:AAA family ATPase n=1 Tax=Fomitopsis serialis TaxID=139415 RepID=UPI0020086915|nr:AAA family ATPase [Neoantrodia serialis]KAH9913006.1 AAA family ATPase [Neoantrodia serialis]
MTSIAAKTFVVSTRSVSGRAARRITINAEVVKATKLCAGDAIAISSVDSGVTAFAVGVVWPSIDISHDAILISKSLLLTAHLSPGAKTQLHPLTGGRPPPHVPPLKNAQAARTIRMREVLPEISTSSANLRSNNDPKTQTHGDSLAKRRDWLTLLVREVLVDQKYLTPTQIVEVSYEGRSRRFAVSAVNEAEGHADDLSENLAALSIAKEEKPHLWTVDWDVIVRLDRDGEKSDRDGTAEAALGKGIERDVDPNAYAAVGGLDKQIAQIRDLIEIPLTRPELFRHFGLKPPRGILLHGPPGTGKTHLARAIAASTRASLLTVNGPELSSAYHGETEAKLRDVFAEARSRAPCIVVLDEVDALCPRREDGPGGEVEKRVVAQLLTIMDGMEAGKEGKEERVVVVATTNRPNAIDPALRRPGRFDREIEIGIPDAEARFHILFVLLSKTPHSISPDDLRAVAAKAHGYVGADLSAVVREAGTLAIKHWLVSSSTASSDPSSSAPQLTLTDLLTALPTIRPSALRSLLLDLTPVRYASIGGQAHTIEKLRECVEWPLLHPEAFARLGVHPPRGVLLYGPPGCSKTLLVRACATESGVNFLAVKGPELLNKYVGESERAVREVFSKARAAAPSLIFFDEIDALATSRTSDTSGGAHEGVLTSLLNEMDGVQELVGVTIVAATNRPEAIDSALMRPGRLDRILYVGPPDASGREEILRIRTARMSVEPEMDYALLAQLTEGCSGAELAALCQEAALHTMKRDMNAPFVPHDVFVEAAKTMKRQITPDVVAKYERWRDQSGVGEA